VGSVAIGLADLITDGIACSRLLHGDVAIDDEGYKTAYVTFLCLGVVTTAISLAFRLRNALLMRAHALKLSQQRRALSGSAARRQAQQHEWELAQTGRTMVVLSLALVNVASQGPDTRCGQIHGLNSTRLWLQVCRCRLSTSRSYS
jgi:hypothetical protein